MADKIANPDFFKNRTSAGKPPENALPKTEKKTAAAPVRKADPAAEKKPVADSSVRLSGKLSGMLDELTAYLKDAGQKSLIPEVEKIRKEVERRRFTVAVVGEFSKGKSTLINRMLDKEFLPTGNLPTTAMLTKIRYSAKEMLILFDKNGRKKKVLPLSEKSWDGMTALDINGTAQDLVLAGVDNAWLRDTGIELEDTPGAGDLDEGRAGMLADALRNDDGAIITVSATAAMSMSEKVFIEERLISPKTPYLALAITKLDRVPQQERAGVIAYVIAKLGQWDRDIPVFIPYDIEIPDNEYSEIIGMDKLKNELSRWVTDPERARLTEQWISNRILKIIDAAAASLNEQQVLIDADEDKRQELIAKKKAKLSEMSVIWEQLKLEMQNKGVRCYEKLLDMIDDNKIKITERLQYEASHAANPERWWKEDYPYRLKVEINNMSSNVDSFVNRRISEDIRWFNSTLNSKFKSQVLVSDSAPEKMVFDDINIEENIEFEDISKKRNLVRIGTAALTAAGYFALASAGAFPIIATLGIGTGSSIISEKIFKGKIEKQQQAMSETIAKNVPEVIDNATSKSEKHLMNKYDEVIRVASQQEEAWLAAQEEAIQNSVGSISDDVKSNLENNKTKLESLRSRIRL